MSIKQSVHTHTTLRRYSAGIGESTCVGALYYRAFGCRGRVLWWPLAHLSVAELTGLLNQGRKKKTTTVKQHTGSFLHPFSQFLIKPSDLIILSLIGVGVNVMDCGEKE